MNALNEIQLLKKVEPFEDEVVERLEALCFPELRKAPPLAEIVPAGRYPRAYARGTLDQNPKSNWSFSWPLSTFS